MFKTCKGLNSKCFLLTYLVIVGFLLILWANRMPLIQEDERVIPEQLQAYLVSPPQKIDEIAVRLNKKQALTSGVFQEKWTFVYFSHWQCLPECDQAYQTLAKLEQALQAIDIQFVLLNLDVDNSGLATDHLLALAKQYLVDAQLIDMTDEAELEIVARRFQALFLKTDYADGSYLIEQEHPIILVDPKGRVYARFVRPYSFELIRQKFIKLRQFYAQSE